MEEEARRRKAAGLGLEGPQLSPAQPTKTGMDFVSNALFNRKHFRALPLIDHFTREGLAIEMGQSMTGQAVEQLLQRACMPRQGPHSHSGQQPRQII